MNEILICNIMLCYVVFIKDSVARTDLTLTLSQRSVLRFSVPRTRSRLQPYGYQVLELVLKARQKHNVAEYLVRMKI